MQGRQRTKDPRIGQVLTVGERQLYVVEVCPSLLDAATACRKARADSGATLTYIPVGRKWAVMSETPARVDAPTPHIEIESGGRAGFKPGVEGPVYRG